MHTCVQSTLYAVFDNNRSGTIDKDFEWHPLVPGVYNEVYKFFFNFVFLNLFFQGIMFVFDTSHEASYDGVKQQFSIYYTVNYILYL